MKKKLLNILACLSIILIGAFALVGCGDDPADTNIYVSTEAQLTTAVNNTAKEYEIVLKNDIALTTQLEVTKEVTLNLNGKKLYTEEDIVNNDPDVKDWSMISVQEGGKLTIKGNGIIEALDGTECYGIDVRGGSLIFKNGTIKANCSAIYVREGSAVVEGGTICIYDNSEAYDFNYVLNCLDANLNNQTATISVTGGTFENYNPANSASENPLKNFVANGYEAVENSGNYVVSKIAD